MTGMIPAHWQDHNLAAAMWCPCGWHRIDHAHTLCPVCQDEATLTATLLT